MGSIEDTTIKYTLEDTILQAYLPYKESVYHNSKNNENKEDSSAVIPQVPSTDDPSDDSDFLRISNRARFSYELDRYCKNAMLIFEGNGTDIILENSITEETSSQIEDNISTKFKKTFEKFRFEVEVYTNLTDDEIASTSERFFQRDFTEYGCVAVMMLMKSRDGLVESTHSPNSEFGVTRYLSDLMPPTLQDKPKIYIVQTEEHYVIPRARVWSTLPKHNLEFRLPAPIITAADTSGKRTKLCCLLEQIQRNIDSLADQTDFYTILYDSMKEFTRCWQLYDLPVGFYNSLTKELRLVRTPEP